MIGLAGLVSGGASSSSALTTGEIRSAVENALNQNNAVFVGGSGKASNTQSASRDVEDGKDNGIFLIVGAVALIAAFLLRK